MIFPWMGNKHRLPIESEREQVLNALLSITQWVEIYYLWRPKLPDEADNHLVELAMAGGASHIITCAEHVTQLGGESPLSSQMRAKD
ncbi:MULTISPECIES: PIN domain-containing protein [unclassified Endozoicomonas]|uniref:PIN domain-containing protein n=1 Tax=unclassified Endozoicomonas TaxID=2644528 RepID=UPI003BB17E4B